MDKVTGIPHLDHNLRSGPERCTPRHDPDEHAVIHTLNDRSHPDAVADQG